MNTSQLKCTKCERDHGVWITSDLTWNVQVNKQCERANKDREQEQYTVFQPGEPSTLP